jgi:uncharacterized membrane protein YhaH (DUF805 family)
MSFTESIGTCFRKYVDVNGRASRSEFWYFQLFLFVLTTISVWIDSAVFGTGLGETGTVYMVVALGTLLPSICANVRRLHDVNKSGWWVLLFFTCIGIIPLIIWEATKGTSGSNEHGDDPLAAAQSE